MKTVLAIDPGAKGGWVLMPQDPDDQPMYGESAMLPYAGKAVDVRFLFGKFEECPPTLVVVEKQGARPHDGKRSLQMTMDNYGMLKGALAMLGWPLLTPTPTAWKRQVLVGTLRDKNAAIQHCLARYPWVDLIPKPKRTHQDGIADAACIAEWGLGQL